MRELHSLSEILTDFDAFVFDQWGVLHNGSEPYAGAIATVSALAQTPARLAVLSNSGKRSSLNVDRIASRGFNMQDFVTVMTSGEALWQDFSHDIFPGVKKFFPICAKPGDAKIWAEGLASQRIVQDVNEADAVLLMGLAEDISDPLSYNIILEQALQRRLPLFCSNPDKTSPRADRLVISSGVLAEQYACRGGIVHYYGKPHPAIFLALAAFLETDPSRILMIGDSLEHDIAGAAAVGWKSLFITGGIHASSYAKPTSNVRVTQDIVKTLGLTMPDFIMSRISL